MKNKFKILEAGNFYFPTIDKGKKFIVKETMDIQLDKKDTKLIIKLIKSINKFSSLGEDIDFKMFADLIWPAVKKEFKKGYKDGWVVPLRLYKLGNDYFCTVDLLEKVRQT